VVYDENSRSGRILEAQEVFALSCIGELSYMVRTGELSYDNKGNALSRAALAVNDPTSLRIDRIARAFDVPVFRAEVGEANVAGLAARLRERGYAVRILGEGSNGGVIIHPSEVRDPLTAAGAVIKLLLLRRTEEQEGLFKLWCDLSDQGENYREDFTLSDIIATLPAFVTTAASSPEAKLRVKTGDHGLLKSRYQKVFLREWEQRKEELLARYGILSWDVRVYNGMEERRGVSDFGEARQGGLKICFANGEGRTIAFLWMRGSATERVFRVMADAEGPDRRMERDLIGWQRRMVEEADAGA
jgi:phosphoglucomutase